MSSVLSAAERAKIGIQGLIERRSTMRCWLWHQWSKWSITESGHIIRSESKAHIGTFCHQQRTCSCCNKIELRTVKTTIL